MKEIKLTDIGNINIGNAQDIENGTGLTVIISKEGMAAGVDIRGGGPASRETPLLNPLMQADFINALVLSGGSAYGLDASSGVMEYLEERNIGLNVGVGVVPLVCQSCIFDLAYKNGKVRPDKKMGYEACLNSELNEIKEGSVGGGTGAAVGKLYGMSQAQKSGLGIYAVEVGGLKLGALVIVNAFGDVFDSKGNKIAGLTNKDGTQFLDFKEEMYRSLAPKSQFTGNTTIGAIITNAKLSKAMLCKVASMAQNGLARRISPVHTLADGDSVYALSVGNFEADINVVGTLACQVMENAIERAVTLSK
ncbi:MAG: P1 family peptidase [Clostridia bacterium]|nr:P1 family peptidase [Clostridia bacterium]